MFWFIVESLIILLSLQDCESARKILGGETLKISEDMTTRYVVYLVRAKEVEVKYYDAWLCGGAIVSPVFIVTSAACVKDVNYLYAVAGTEEYYNDAEIYDNACFKNGRKKIIYICIPQHYTFVEKEVERWSEIDIAVVKVESPYNFDKVVEGCSFAPGPIAVNYYERTQLPGADVLVYGWGHDKDGGWRKPSDRTNYNKQYLKFAPTAIINKDDCLKSYDDHPKMSNVIKKYMICTNGRGRIQSDGKFLSEEESEEYKSHCRDLRSMPALLRDCLEQEKKFKDVMAQDYETRGTEKYENHADYGGHPNEESGVVDLTRRHTNQTLNGTIYTHNSRREVEHTVGICQNDHGGPLVAWRGPKEVLIGVASVFRVSIDYRCTGPFLFTSTFCNGKFLQCVLNGKLSARYSRNFYPKWCDAPPEVSGFKKFEQFRSWIGHPDGPSENELVTTRPVLPIG